MYYCLYCGWNANVEFFETQIGKKWICKSCGNYGNCGDQDEPKLLAENTQGELESDFDFSQRIFYNKDPI